MEETQKGGNRLLNRQFSRCLNGLVTSAFPLRVFSLIVSHRYRDLKMSHSINVTRTTTTVTSSGVFINTGFFKTVPGILKLLQTILGAVVVALMSQHLTDSRYYYILSRELFMLLIATTFMIATFILLLSSLLSLYTATTLPKTMFELLYHSFGFILYLAASVTILVTVNQYQYSKITYDSLLAAGIIGLINSVLYLASAVFTYRSYVM